MSIQDLVFTTTVDSAKIFDPLETVTATPVQVTVTNHGIEDLTNLGLYVVPTTNLGDVDNPADFPPETDFQDLIEWGTSTELGLTVQGGLKITSPQTAGGTVTEYARREKGSMLGNKIAFQDLAAGTSATFTLELETPPAIASRRLFVNVVLE